MARFNPSNVSGAKRTFITDSHLTARHHIDRIVGVPMLICIKVRRKFRLNEKRPVIF